MDEVWVRTVLVAGALVIVLASTWWRRRAGKHHVVEVETVSLEPGVYLFSSAACPTCKDARKKLKGMVGESGYVEFFWEEEPRVFQELDIGAVPAVLVVTEDGSGRIYPGQPDETLQLV